MDSQSTPMADDAWTSNGNGNGSTSTMDKAREQTNHLVHQAQQKAGEMVGQAGDQVKSQLSSQKERASDSLETMAQALRETGKSLQDQQYEAVGKYIDTAAEQLDRVSTYLQEKDVDELMGQVQDFARSRPALILGATFVLGFLAARLIKNAETDGSSQSDFTPSAQPDFSSSGYAQSSFSSSDNPPSGATSAFNV
ncbi:MAG: hypothetical protein KY468_04585 [Armatimonadetes bacterium]|nr:hypothetical protein [Armatimonadota bacterium]